MSLTAELLSGQSVKRHAPTLLDVMIHWISVCYTLSHVLLCENLQASSTQPYGNKARTADASDKCIHHLQMNPTATFLQPAALASIVAPARQLSDFLSPAWSLFRRSIPTEGSRNIMDLQPLSWPTQALLQICTFTSSDQLQWCQWHFID